MTFLSSKSTFQIRDKKPIKQLHEHAAKVLACQLFKFSQLPEGLPGSLYKRILTVSNPEEMLKSGGYIIHKACYDKFNDHKYERAIKRKVNTSTAHAGASIECPPKKLSTRSASAESIPFGQELCMYCNKKDMFDTKHPQLTADLKLHAAAGKSKSIHHVNSFTTELRIMATELQDSKMLGLLNAGDVRSQELYYHLKCHNEYCNRFV